MGYDRYSALVLVAFISAAACGGTVKQRPQLVPARPVDENQAIRGDLPSAAMREFDPRLTPAEVAGAAADSVVVVQTSDGLGTGFAVAPDQILTALHVVAGAEVIAVSTRSGETLKVTAALAFDVKGDLALLQVAGLKLVPLAISTSEFLAPGSPITVIASPRGLSSTVSTGVVSATRTMDGTTLLQLTAAVSPGSSGGPVLDDRARVVGVVRGYLDGQQLNFATSSSSVNQLRSVARLPWSLHHFAELTAPPREADAPTTNAPTTAPTAVPVASAFPPFPMSVAGFQFGATLAQLQLSCTTMAEAERAKRNLPWRTLLTVDGAYATCPDQVTALDFTKREVFFQFAGNRVVKVLLYLNSYSEGAQRVSEKYGSPSAMWSGGTWKPWNAKVAGQPALSWSLTGGTVLLYPTGKEKLPPVLVFRSDEANELRNEGF